MSARRNRISTTGAPKLLSLTGLGCAAPYPLGPSEPQRPPWGPHGLPAGLGWAPFGAFGCVRTRPSPAKPACWKCGSRYNGSIVWGICGRPDAPTPASDLARSATCLQEGPRGPSLPESGVGETLAWNRLGILILAWNSNSGVGVSPNVSICINRTRFLCEFGRRAMQILAWSDTDSGVEPFNSGVELSNSGVERS